MITSNLYGVLTFYIDESRPWAYDTASFRQPETSSTKVMFKGGILLNMMVVSFSETSADA
jgi:hypothetical protein